MALFAGDEGIEVGEELTYDYNFRYLFQLLSSQGKNQNVINRLAPSSLITYFY